MAAVDVVAADAQRRSPAGRWMFVACSAGMLLGLLVDARSLPLESLAQLCLADDGWLARMRLHWRLLPGMHVGMLAAALLLMLAERGRLDLRRSCAHGVCVGMMFIGMAALLPAAPALAVWFDDSAAAGMLAATLLGMALGMRLAQPLYRRRIAAG